MCLYPGSFPPVAKITFVVDETMFKVAEITFKVVSVADISLLVAKISFAVSEIIIKEAVITYLMISKLSVILTEL